MAAFQVITEDSYGYPPDLDTLGRGTVSSQFDAKSPLLIDQVIELACCSQDRITATYGAIKACTWVSLSVAPLPLLPKITSMQSPEFTSTGLKKILSTVA